MRLDGTLSRAAIVRSLVAVPSSLVAVPLLTVSAATSTFVNPVTGDSKASWQSDDKSFDFSVPSGWVVEENPRGAAGHLISATAKRSCAQLEASCDLGKFGTSLAAYATVDRAAQLLLDAQPGPTELLSATRVPGAVKGSFYYVHRYLAAGKECASKQTVLQNRLYQLTVRSDTPSMSPALREEVDGIVAAFNAFPVNFIGIGQSNGGKVPADGSCY